MSKRESVQKRLQRVRPPRVQLTYDVERGDAIEQKELPFVLGVMGDFAAQSVQAQERLRELAGLLDTTRLVINDFALVRQSRWREAIAAVFDMPDELPYLSSLKRIAVTYATHDETGDPGTTNVVKPLYHVAWLASRLGLRVVSPLAPVATNPSTETPQRRPATRSAAFMASTADLTIGSTAPAPNMT